MAVTASTAVLAALLLAYALWRPALRRSPREWLGALVIGTLVAAGWWISANVGFDPFEPIPLISLSFVGPVADTLLYVQMAAGRSFSSMAQSWRLLLQPAGESGVHGGSLAVRVGISVALFICLLIAWKLGYIQPTGLAVSEL